MNNLSLPVEKALIAQGLEATQHCKLVVCCHQLADFGVPFHNLFVLRQHENRMVDRRDKVFNILLAPRYISTLVTAEPDSLGSQSRIIL